MLYRFAEHNRLNIVSVCTVDVVFYSSKLHKVRNNMDKILRTGKRRITQYVADRSDYIRAIHSFSFHSSGVLRAKTVI